MEVSRTRRAVLLLLLVLAVTLVGPAGAAGGRRGRRGRGRGAVTPPPPPPVTEVLAAPHPEDHNATLSPTAVTPATLEASSTSRAPQPQVKQQLLEALRISPVLPTPAHPRSDVQIGCKELRSKRYISDGFCTSIKPVTEVVCTGHCLPMTNLPWYAEFIKVWARTKVLEWRCVNDVVKRRRVRLLCENGETRTYRIKVVKSCKCKRYMKQQNQSLASKGRTNGSNHHRRREKELAKKARTNRVPS